MDHIDRHTILSQVDRITSSKAFKRSIRLSQFLKFIVNQHLENKAGQIKEYTIAVHVFNRPDSVDIRIDNIVRVYGGKLRRELSNYYQNEGKNDPIEITVPKGGYIPRIKRKNKTQDGMEGSPSSEKEPVANAEFDGPEIAVIVFDCLNEKENYGHFARGLSEEIMIALGRFSEIKAIGPLHRDILHKKGLDVQGIGEYYKVQFVLDGTVRIHDHHLRLTVSLKEVSRGHQLWGQVMDSDLGNGSIANFEKDVVSRVVSTVADNYGIISRVYELEYRKRPSENPAIYEAILHYYNCFIVLTSDTITKAIAALEQALVKEPRNALVLAMLGDLILSTYQFGYSDSDALVDRGHELGLKAVAIDPGCQTARFLLGVVYFFRAKRILCLEEFEYALKLNPNNAHYTAAISLHLTMMGYWDRGLELMDKACRMNPHYPGWHHLVYFMNHYRQGKYDLAYNEALRFNSPEYYWDPLIRAAALGQLGRPAEARDALNDLLALVPDFVQRGRDRIIRFAFEDANVDLLWDGLKKAGIESLRREETTSAK